MKTRTIISACSLIAGLALAGPAANAQPADGVPNLLGQWTCEAQAVVQGGGRHFAAGELGDTRVVRNRYTYVIERQEGNAFAGYFVGEVTGFREPVIGAIHPNGRQGIAQDEDGSGTFDLGGPDDMNLCYRHAEPASRVAVCYVLRRQK